MVGSYIPPFVVRLELWVIVEYDGPMVLVVDAQYSAEVDDKVFTVSLIYCSQCRMLFSSQP